MFSVQESKEYKATVQAAGFIPSTGMYLPEITSGNGYTAGSTISGGSLFRGSLTNSPLVSSSNSPIGSSSNSPTGSFASVYSCWRSSGTSLASSGTSLASSGTSLASSGTSLASSGKSLASSGTSLASSGTSLASSGTSLASSGTSLASSGTPIGSIILRNVMMSSQKTSIENQPFVGSMNGPFNNRRNPTLAFHPTGAGEPGHLEFGDSQSKPINYHHSVGAIHQYGVAPTENYDYEAGLDYGHGKYQAPGSQQYLWGSVSTTPAGHEYKQVQFECPKYQPYFVGNGYSADGPSTNWKSDLGTKKSKKTRRTLTLTDATNVTFTVPLESSLIDEETDEYSHLNHKNTDTNKTIFDPVTGYGFSMITTENPKAFGKETNQEDTKMASNIYNMILRYFNAVYVAALFKSPDGGSQFLLDKAGQLAIMEEFRASSWSLQSLLSKAMIDNGSMDLKEVFLRFLEIQSGLTSVLDAADTRSVMNTLDRLETFHGMIGKSIKAMYECYQLNSNKVVN